MIWKLQKYFLKTQVNQYENGSSKKVVNPLWGNSALGLENLIEIRIGIELHFYF
jgi:hypothetical protein